jgi:hypothetical protein
MSTHEANHHADHAAREHGVLASSPTLGAWVAPPPTQLPDLRIQLREQMLTRPHCDEFGRRITGGISPLIPRLSGPPEQKAALGILAQLTLVHSEQRRLNQAQLYWVDQDMTALALAAAASPSHEVVTARRMPAEAGLMIFAAPIGSYDIDLATAMTGPWSTPAPGVDGLRLSLPAVGVSWSHWSPADLDGQGAPCVIQWTPRTPPGAAPVEPEFEGVWMTIWTTGRKGWEALPPDLPVAIARHDGTTITAGQMIAREALMGTSPLHIYGEVLLRFGQPLRPLDPDDASQWAPVVYTAWQLMAQTGNAQLTQTETVPRPRAGLKRDRRAQIAGPGTVHLVRVHTRHRPSAQASAEDAAASDGRRAPQWTRRWPVRPYRRNTCLNPRAHAEGGCEHEEMIVPAHIKGPADKPLVTTDRVHVWDTPPPPLPPSA